MLPATDARATSVVSVMRESEPVAPSSQWPTPTHILGNNHGAVMGARGMRPGGLSPWVSLCLSLCLSVSLSWPQDANTSRLRDEGVTHVAAVGDMREVSVSASVSGPIAGLPGGVAAIVHARFEFPS